MTQRLIEVPWTCRQTGDCCKAVPVVTMTREEQALLVKVCQDRNLVVTWLPFEGHDPEKRFVSLKAQPCPFLSPDNLCSVHDVRPYNCRRFICGRVDVHSEPFEQGGPLGCWNASDRIEQSPRFFEHFQTTMRKAMAWALAHGWRRTDGAAVRR
jgi:Fe-S-cluster containining protein